MLKALLGAFALVFVANGAIAFDARPAAPSVGIEQTTTKSYISIYYGDTSSSLRLWTSVIPVGKYVLCVYNGHTATAVVAGPISNPYPGAAIQVSHGVKQALGMPSSAVAVAYTWN